MTSSNSAISLSSSKSRDKPQGLEAFFNPRGIAVVGASEGVVKAGGRTLHNLDLFGYKGHIYPVTPRSGELYGHPTVLSLDKIDGPVDLVIICVKAELVPGILREAGHIGAGAAVVYAAGYDDPALADELEEARRESGVRVIGPNTVGIRMLESDGTGVFGTFSGDIENGLTPGPVAMIAQSGGLGVYFGSAYLRELGTGTKYLLDTGSEMDVDCADLIEYVTNDEEIRVIAVLLEGARDGRKLQRVIEDARARDKHVIFLKVGRSSAAAEQVASHTGSMVGSSELFDAAMRDAGAIVAQDEGEFVDAVRLCATDHRPAGRRIGVVTPSGGFGILAIDAAERFELEIPQVNLSVPDNLTEALSNALLSNPLDYMAKGAEKPDSLAAALTWMAAQPNIDAVVLWQAYVLMRQDQRERLEQALEKLDSVNGKPLFGCGITTKGFERQLKAKGMQWWNEPTRLFRAIALAAPSEPGPSEMVSQKDNPVAEQPQALMGFEARSMVPIIPHADTTIVDSAIQACNLARQWGKMVLKVEDPRFPHKTELGLVSGIVSEHQAEAAYHSILKAQKTVGAVETPIIAQKAETGVELAFGGYNDPVFGASVMVAMGGIHIEVDKDMAVSVAPIDVNKATEMIMSLRGSPLLRGARGRALADVKAAAIALSKFSSFYVDHANKYSSIDINPVMVKPEGEGIVAVDLVLVPSKTIGRS